MMNTAINAYDQTSSGTTIMNPSSMETLINHQSALSTPIVRNKKVACSYNMQFKQFSLPSPPPSTDMKAIYPIVKEVLTTDLSSGTLHNGPFVRQNNKELFSIETDLDEETFETSILKRRKTIRFKLGSELLSSLFYGADEPHNSIYAYLFQLDDPQKLKLFTTESMKGKMSRNIIKFDIFKKVKISSIVNNFMIGIIVLTTSDGFDKNSRVHVLNGTTVFTKMIDNEKKRKLVSSSLSNCSESDDGYVECKVPKLSESPSEEPCLDESKKFQIFMQNLAKVFRTTKTMKDFENFCKNDDRSNILLHLLTQSKKDSTQVAASTDSAMETTDMQTLPNTNNLALFEEDINGCDYCDDYFTN